MRKPNPEDADGLAAVLKSLGMPDEASAYAAPEDATFGDERLGQLQAMAHKAGLTQQQFKQFTQEMVQGELQATTLANTELQAGIDRLKGEWGTAYESRMAQVVAMAERTKAPASLIQAIKDGQVGGEYLQWFQSQADSLGGGEGTNVGNQGKGEPAPVMTPAEALSQLSEVENRLFNKDTPADQVPYLTQKRMELMKHAYPDSNANAPARAGLV